MLKYPVKFGPCSGCGNPRVELLTIVDLLKMLPPEMRSDLRMAFEFAAAGLENVLPKEDPIYTLLLNHYRAIADTLHGSLAAHDQASKAEALRSVIDHVRGVVTSQESESATTMVARRFIGKELK